MADNKNNKINNENFEILESFQVLLRENEAFREMILEISEVDTKAAEKSAKGEDYSEEENKRRELIKNLRDFSPYVKFRDKMREIEMKTSEKYKNL